MVEERTHNPQVASSNLARPIMSIKLKKIEAGHYETHDGEFRIFRTIVPNCTYRPATWIIKQFNPETNDYELCCELFTLRDARKHLNGEPVTRIS